MTARRPVIASPMTPILAGLMALVAGCTDPQPGEVPIAPRDPDAYVRSVQPYVGVRCGSLDCHGDSGRPLRLYAEDGLRLTDELRGQPITTAETAHNAASFGGVDPDHDDPVDGRLHLAMRKGLAVDAGGFAHEGGDVWDRTDRVGYLCLLGWLERRTADAAFEAACADAYLEVEPQP